jgi:hypothetical protein
MGQIDHDFESGRAQTRPLGGHQLVVVAELCETVDPEKVSKGP